MYHGNFTIGDFVKSDKIGEREAFVGVISEKIPCGFNVTDVDGVGWFREPRELTFDMPPCREIRANTREALAS